MGVGDASLSPTTPRVDRFTQVLMQYQTLGNPVNLHLGRIDYGDGRGGDGNPCSLLRYLGGDHRTKPRTYRRAASAGIWHEG